MENIQLDIEDENTNDSKMLEKENKNILNGFIRATHTEIWAVRKGTGGSVCSLADKNGHLPQVITS